MSLSANDLTVRGQAAAKLSFRSLAAQICLALGRETWRKTFPLGTAAAQSPATRDTGSAILLPSLPVFSRDAPYRHLSL